MNNRITLWRNDKIPYGTWYAYGQLAHIFPKSTIHINKRSPNQQKAVSRELLKSPSVNDYSDGKKAYIIIASEVIPDAAEINALFGLAASGNHVFISAFRISEAMLDTMKLSAALYSPFYKDGDSLTLTIEEPVTEETYTYQYPGRSIDNYFSKVDSSITNIEGTDKRGRADFVRFTYEGGGSLMFHLAPLAFTNFFLLHKNNNDYYEQALSYLPPSVTDVYWDDYFRYSSSGQNNRNNDFSALGWVMKQRGLREAVWLIMALLVFVYLFESKRKQRIIPVIAPLRNTSLEFVKTIGRLYYQRRDNRNLAIKLKAHFLDQVRMKYNLQTNLLNDDFVKRLAYKSGYPEQAVHQVVDAFKLAEKKQTINEEELMELNDLLENFNKHTS